MPHPMTKARLAALTLAAALMVSALPPRAALAQTVSVEAVSFGSPMVMIRMPKIEIEGSSLSQTEVTQLLSNRDVKSIAATLARLNARTIRVPEFRIEQKIPEGDGKDMTNTTIYRDFVMSDVTAGKARSVQIAGGTVENKSAKTGAINGKIGRIAADDVDVTMSLRFYSDSAQPGENDRKSVYRNMVMEGMTMTGPEGLDIVLGKMTIGDAKVRPMKESLADYLQFIAGLKDKKPTAAETKRIITMIAEILDAFETSPATIDGMRIKAVDKNKKPVDFGIEKITVGAFANRTYPAFDLSNMQVKAPDGSMKLAGAGWKATDLNPTLTALHSINDADFETWAQTNWRQLIPAFGGFYLNGIDFDLPDEKNKGQRIKGKLGEFDLTLAKYLGGIPTDIGAKLKNLAFDIPAGTKDKGLADLLELGYRKIDVSAAFGTTWDEAAKNIKVTSLAFEGAEMGAVNVASTIGNAVRELFTGDKNAMQLAALGLTMKDINVSIKNSGIFDKVYEREAKKGKKSPAQLKQEIAGMAQALIPAFLGGSDAATAVGKAVAQFAEKPNMLTVNAKSKEPNGITLLEAMMNSGNPMALLPKIDISAKAN